MEIINCQLSSNYRVKAVYLYIYRLNYKQGGYIYIEKIPNSGHVCPATSIYKPSKKLDINQDINQAKSVNRGHRTVLNSNLILICLTHVKALI